MSASDSSANQRTCSTASGQAHAQQRPCEDENRGTIVLMIGIIKIIVIVWIIAIILIIGTVDNYDNYLHYCDYFNILIFVTGTSVIDSVLILICSDCLKTVLSPRKCLF